MSPIEHNVQSHYDQTVETAPKAKGQKESSPPLVFLRWLLHEIPTLVRASASSIAATVVDGVVYQAVLFCRLGNYTVAAIAGAVTGGITNFVLNRLWAFPPTSRDWKQQAGLYALASGVVYLGFQACLMVFIEMLHVNEHLAWFPAQLIAWVGVSYPLFRFVVFARPR